jgi:putative PD-(D/E)XK family protein DUF4420
MNDPWRAINKPSGAAVNAKRADEKHPFDFFWAMDLDGHCLFIYEYDKSLKFGEKRPRLEGVSIIDFLPDGGDKRRLILSLRQSEHREIFYRLCTDVLEATEKCKDPASALHVMIRRTWRWHQLLRGERDGRLSPEAQKGLIGELECLTNIVLPKFTPAEVMTFWEGPAGLPKDFVIGESCIEVKARRGAARPFVSISSEHQLDQAGFQNLFLYVVDLSPAAGTDEGSFNLNDYVDQAYQHIYDIDPGAVEIFETKLLEVGYQKEDDYTDRYWIRLGASAYLVKNDFPRIVSDGLSQGIADVTYKIDLGDVQDYAVAVETMESTMTGEHYE